MFRMHRTHLDAVLDRAGHLVEGDGGSMQRTITIEVDRTRAVEWLFARLAGPDRLECFFQGFGRQGTVRLQRLAVGLPGAIANLERREGLVATMSVTRNISLAALPRLSPRGLLRDRREREVAENRKADFGIRVASLNQEVGTLSGGNQQKVALAKCLEALPRVLLLNEPTRGVDVGAKHEIYALMNAWTAAGIAILLITSEMPELLALSDRILALHQGRVTAEFTREDATPEAVLAASMGGFKKDTQ